MYIFRSTRNSRHNEDHEEQRPVPGVDGGAKDRGRHHRGDAAHQHRVERSHPVRHQGVRRAQQLWGGYVLGERIHSKRCFMLSKMSTKLDRKNEIF